MALTFGMPAHADSQGKLYECVKAGVPGCKFAFGTDSVFPVFDRDQLEGRTFNQAMSALSLSQGGIVAASYDFSQCKKIVDVGGSKGTLIQQILDAHPGLPLGISLDRKEVIDTLTPAPADSRLQFATGDFFQPLPESVSNADAVLMKLIMHDWGDAHCQKILQNCKAILSPEGVIIIIDVVMAETLGAAPHSLPQREQSMDLLMMSLTNGGKERTLKEWERLAASVDMKLLPSPGGSGLVWGRPPATMVVMQPV
ncbi:O-methyltransferase [Dunaliella salina]|nr:O-methyltransferase [Dunaliella salina]|eukprot:KAF5831954.1 O-methyltransferase [Dunaliella salina]